MSLIGLGGFGNIGRGTPWNRCRWGQYPDGRCRPTAMTGFGVDPVDPTVIAANLTPATIGDVATLISASEGASRRTAMLYAGAAVVVALVIDHFLDKRK